MSIEVKMPALSPTMEKGTLAKWFVKEGDIVAAGDILAEIETDKATMEFEAADQGRIAKILIAEGTDEVAVGTVIALIGEEVSGEAPVKAERELVTADAVVVAPPPPAPEPIPAPPQPSIAPPRARLADKVKVSPLAARIAEARSIDLSPITGTGPGGRIVKADLGLKPIQPTVATAPAFAPAPTAHAIPDVPHDLIRLSSMRKTIARRLTESKQQIPHIYLTVDVMLDPLLKLRTELNAALEPRGIKLSINDLVIKALALALLEVPQCNVQFAGDQIAQFKRADISVAVSIPNGLITPVISDAGSKSLSAIATEMQELAAKAREGRLQPHEYQGGTASLSNLGMFGVKQFEAVINPPQAMILAVGVGERRPIVDDDDLRVATMMCATGSFDHRAIDGANAAELMKIFKQLVEKPLKILA